MTSDWLRGWTVTPAGRGAAAVAGIAWLVSWQFGWQEFAYVAAGSAVALLFSLLFALGRTSLTVELGIEPDRVVVGQQAVGHVTARNSASRRMLPVRLEVPVGTGIAMAAVPALAAGDEHSEVFVVPTRRRAVINVGPARSVRGDPLGLTRRESSWGDKTRLYVHPRTVPLPGLTAGWLRDLEGITSNDRSTSDVAFHTLREYVPGDDRRHIHWRTSARLGQLMVREFVDTRRSHLGIVLERERATYAHPDDFELAVSITASLGTGVLLQQQDLTCCTGVSKLPSYARPPFLDAMAGIELDDGPTTLVDTLRFALPHVGPASIIALVFGGLPTTADVRAAQRALPGDARVIVVQCEVGTPPTSQRLPNGSILRCGQLEDLRPLFRMVNR